MRKIFKQIIFVGLLFFLVFLVLVFLQWPDNKVHLVVCDVGQGDAVLLWSGHWQMLIDGGPNKKVLNCLNKHLPFWDRHLEVVLLTHSDSDHLKGLILVLERYQVDEFFFFDYQNSDLFLDLKKVVKNSMDKGMQLENPFLTPQISFQDRLKASFITTHISKQQAKKGDQSNYFKEFSENMLSDNWPGFFINELDHNNLSIGVFLEIGKFKAILMGDIENEGELALLENDLIEDIDILKVGHHGSKSSSSRLFLRKFNPEVGLISCGKNNSFAHPHQETLKNLQAVGAKIYRTDWLGTIEVTIDGEDYEVINNDY